MGRVTVSNAISPPKRLPSRTRYSHRSPLPPSTVHQRARAGNRTAFGGWWAGGSEHETADVGAFSLARRECVCGGGAERSGGKDVRAMGWWPTARALWGCGLHMALEFPGVQIVGPGAILAAPAVGIRLAAILAAIRSLLREPGVDEVRRLQEALGAWCDPGSRGARMWRGNAARGCRGGRGVEVAANMQPAALWWRAAEGALQKGVIL